MLPLFLLLAVVEWLMHFQHCGSDDFMHLSIREMRVRSGLLPPDWRYDKE